METVIEYGIVKCAWCDSDDTSYTRVGSEFVYTVHVFCGECGESDKTKFDDSQTILFL